MNSPQSLRSFIVIWSGQLVSLLGSEMTNFAVTLWVWDKTGHATSLSLILLFAFTPRLITALFSGVIVDAWNRKQLMMLADSIVGLSTTAVLLLLLTGNLEIWHLYITSAINGLFGYLQSLAHSASMVMLIPKKHYAKASSLDSLKEASAYVLAPAIAGALYPRTGLRGILWVDLATCIIALTTLWVISIPQPAAGAKLDKICWRQIFFGFNYIFKRPGLLAILLFLLVSNLFGSASYPLISPLILARTAGSAETLAGVQSALGVGAVIGAALLSLFGSPKPRIHGVLLGMTLPQFGLLAIAMGQEAVVWIGAALATALFVPLVGSCNQAIWLAKVDPKVQGQVFASRFLIAQLASPIGYALTGPLADWVFEPAMQPDGLLAHQFGPWLGSGPGAGMALQLIVLAGCSLAIGIGGYRVRLLRNVEAIVPDYEAQIT